MPKLTEKEVIDNLITPIEYATRVMDGFVRRPHLELINREIGQLVGGLNDRLIISMPPGHGKTQIVSKILPAWYLGMFPDRKVMVVSYSEDLSRECGMAARSLCEEFNPAIFGVGVNSKINAADWWQTTHGGAMYSVPLGGTITGRRFNLGIIDDFMKDRTEAESPTIRNRHWRFFLDVFRKRRRNDRSPMLIMATRWHTDDLIGRILQAVEDGKEPPWRVLSIPALAEENDILGRGIGEALWPEVMTAQALEIERNLDPYGFTALYQQRPVPLEGGLFKADWFEGTTIEPPVGCTYCRYWDRASSVGKGDWSVGALMARSPEGRYYIVDIVRGRWAAGDRDRIIRDTAEADAMRYPGVVIRGEQEPGSSGKDAAQAFVRLLAGFDVSCRTNTGDKESRARPLAAQCQGGNVILVQSSRWNRILIEEFASFGPGCLHDDIVDACSGAFNELAQNVPAQWGYSPVAGFCGRLAG